MSEDGYLTQKKKKKKFHYFTLFAPRLQRKYNLKPIDSSYLIPTM